MQILSSNQRLVLLEYMSRLRFHLPEWLIVEIKVTDAEKTDLNSKGVADFLNRTFEKYEGRILICNASEILMFIEWGQANAPKMLAQKIDETLPADVCETKIAPPTKEGLSRIALMIAPAAATEKNTLHAVRAARQENIFLLADDDLYIRTLAKKALQDRGAVFETGAGGEVLDAYKTHNPDIVLLDIHMPGLSGQEILNQLKDLDPKAYVIMLSADSSVENIHYTKEHGAKGFLAKPFNKSRLLEYVDACPTTR